MKFDNTYIKLPSNFYKATLPTPCLMPELLAWNKDLAEKLGCLDSLNKTSDVIKYFSGNEILPGSEPVSLIYAGHQFGNFVNQLGDGRAVLLGELIDSDTNRFDLQLKGSGRTPFSRDGDGRSAMGPVLREYIISEAMFHLGIPTTRALAAIKTGELVIRDRPEPGAILTRVASSHIRFGTFEYFAVRGDKINLRKLLNYTIERHFPDLKESSESTLDLFRRISALQAELISKWMGVGFVHGVMNTDNCLVSGETIDYGPCAFLDEFDFFKTFSSIDSSKRYAFGRQAQIAQWNLARLAAAFLVLGGVVEKYEEELENFQNLYEKNFLNVIGKKLGFSEIKKNDEEIISKWFEHLQKESLDYTLSFRHLADQLNDKSPKKFGEFEDIWKIRINDQSDSLTEVKRKMNTLNPIFIPRNHQIEKAIKIALEGNLSGFNDLNTVLRKPFDKQPGMMSYAEAPVPTERVSKTFCGT